MDIIEIALMQYLPRIGLLRDAEYRAVGTRTAALNLLVETVPHDAPFDIGGSVLTEEPFKVFLGLPLSPSILRRPCRLPESEELAEVATLFVTHPLRIRFSAPIMREFIVKSAVDTRVKIRTTV
jgi:hypothetical protein